jgi:hypothetical protein
MCQRNESAVDDELGAASSDDKAVLAAGAHLPRSCNGTSISRWSR